jgi:hypothetical protein
LKQTCQQFHQLLRFSFLLHKSSENFYQGC